jgi:hypothetical protein
MTDRVRVHLRRDPGRTGGEEEADANGDRAQCREKQRQLERTHHLHCSVVLCVATSCTVLQCACTVGSFEFLTLCFLYNLRIRAMHRVVETHQVRMDTLDQIQPPYSMWMGCVCVK